MAFVILHLFVFYEYYCIKNVSIRNKKTSFMLYIRLFFLFPLNLKAVTTFCNPFI
nr:MAG TPA: hypothetical protein [Caudoviricetes sp.]